MTIRRGENWGRSRALPPQGAVVHSDAEVRRIVADAAQFEFQNPMPIWLVGDKIAVARRLAVRVEPDALTCVV